MLKRNALFLIVIVFLCATLSSGHATVINSSITMRNIDKNISNLFLNYIDCIERQDDTGLASLYAPTVRDIHNYAGCVDGRIGIMSIERLSIQEIKEISYKQAITISAYIGKYDTYIYDDVRYYYVGFLQEVLNETDLFWNGVAYQVFQVVKSAKEYFILDNQYIYDFPFVIASGCAFNSKHEKQAAYVQEQHSQGNLINFYGEQIIPYEPYLIDGSLFLKKPT
jgi:hypothetical protein